MIKDLLNRSENKINQFEFSKQVVIRKHEFELDLNTKVKEKLQDQNLDELGKVICYLKYIV